MRKAIWFFLLLLMASGLAAQDASESFSILTAENAQNLREIQTWTEILHADFSPDGTTIAIMKLTGELEFISTETLETIEVIDGLETGLERMNSLYYSADGSELLLSNYAGHALLDLETGEIIATYTTEEGFTFGYTDDFRRFLQIEIGGDYVIVYETLSNEELLRVDDVSDYDLSADGTLLATMQSNEPHVQVWDIESRSIVFEIAAPSIDIVWSALAGTGFSPDGLVWVNWIEQLETTNGEAWASSIQFWDMASARMMFKLEGDAAYSGLIFENDYALAFGLSFNFSQICSLWNIVENRELACPTGGNGYITFSPNTELFVVSNGTSPNLYFYALENTQRPIHTLETGSTAFLAFSPDTRFILSRDLELRLWAVPASAE